MRIANWKDIYSAVAENSAYAVIECAERIEDRIMNKWQSEPHANFERELRLCIQKNQRMKRDLVEEYQEIPYQLGRLAGYIRAFEQLYRAEGEQQNIVETLAQSSGKTRQILNCLYQEREHGMRHSILAEAIGSPPSSLSNLMKRILLSGAVEASRSGKNTYYRLTSAGERYCTQTQEKQPEPNLREIIEEALAEPNLRGIIEEALARVLVTEFAPRRIEEQAQPPTQKLNAGDIFVAPQNTVPGEMYQVKSIAAIGSIKCIEAEIAGFGKNNSSAPPEEQPVATFYQNILSYQPVS